MWREVWVPGCITLDLLHDVVQIAMGWEDRHVWQFEHDGTVYEDGGELDAGLNGESDARDMPLDRLASSPGDHLDVRLRPWHAVAAHDQCPRR